MDIAALSMGMSNAKVMQQVSVAVCKNAMDVSEAQMQGLVDMMQKASPPNFGQRLDTYA